MAKMRCQNSETPELINIKFGMGDQVGDLSSRTPQLKAIIAPVGASWHMGEISLSHGF